MLYFWTFVTTRCNSMTVGYDKCHRVPSVTYPVPIFIRMKSREYTKETIVSGPARTWRCNRYIGRYWREIPLIIIKQVSKIIYHVTMLGWGRIVILLDGLEVIKQVKRKRKKECAVCQFAMRELEPCLEFLPLPLQGTSPSGRQVFFPWYASWIKFPIQLLLRCLNKVKKRPWRAKAYSGSKAYKASKAVQAKLKESDTNSRANTICSNVIIVFIKLSITHWAYKLNMNISPLTAGLILFAAL